MNNNQTTALNDTHSLAQLSSMVEVIRYWQSQQPNAEILRFYPQGEGDFQLYSYAEFDLRCRAIAAELQSLRGQRLILLFHSGLSFLEAFFACFYAGVIAVPAYPPRRNQNADRLINLIDDCQPAGFLSCDSVLQQSKALCEEIFDHKTLQLPWIDINNINQDSATYYKEFSPKADDIAFLQYTSGSTGTPKGVMVSHGNLIANVDMAKHAFALETPVRCISWLPLFHDMGLIGAVMMPIFWGTGSVLMPPAAFLQKPLRWLNLLHEFGQKEAVGSAAPNFAYQLCVDHIQDEDLKTLNLSSWHLALAGAEPNRSQTLQDFSKKLAPCHFQAKYIAPSYGMAECTLLASTAYWHQNSSIAVCSESLKNDLFIPLSEGTQIMVSAGHNIKGQDIAIIDIDSAEQKNEAEIGEICLSGEHIAKGYWQQSTLNKKAFELKIDGYEHTFLRTGDLGCLYQNELYITGRLKDLLIIRGRNHYPQDIELTCSNSLETLQSDHCAAFTLYDEANEEKLIIVQELTRQARKDFECDQSAQIIRNNIAKVHGLEVSAIVFIRFASIAKTSSGKIQRHKVKQQYIAHQLHIIDQWKAAENKSILTPIPTVTISDISIAALEQWIAEWFAQKLQVVPAEIPIQAPLDGFGLDSVDLVQFSAVLETWINQPINHSLLWEQDNIHTLALALKALDVNSDNRDSDEELEGFI